jgi:hypothetical protein
MIFDDVGTYSWWVKGTRIEMVYRNFYWKHSIDVEFDTC